MSAHPAPKRTTLTHRESERMKSLDAELCFLHESILRVIGAMQIATAALREGPRRGA